MIFRLIRILALLISLPALATEWYIEQGASGSHNGTSWANAWTNFSQIAWASIQPGDTVWIGAPTGTTNYHSEALTQYGASPNNGTAGSPITYRSSTNASHNGRVVINNSVYFKAKYHILDGSRSSWAPTTVVQVPGIVTNINLEINATNSYASLQTTAPEGVKFRWVEVSHAGYQGVNVDGILFNGNSGITITNCAVEYCYVHDCWGFGIDAMGFSQPFSFKQLEVHHSLIERTHDNYTQTDSCTDFHDNIMRAWIVPEVGHADGFQGLDVFTRIYNNILQDQPGRMIYPTPTGTNGLVHDLLVYNNIFNTTTQNWQQCVMITGHGTPGPGPLMTITNCLFANNFFWDPAGGAIIEVNRGLYPDGYTDGLITNTLIANNIILTTNSVTTELLQFRIPSEDGNGIYGFDYSTDSLMIDYNIISGATSYGQGVHYGGTHYLTLAAFNTGTGFAFNSNSTPVFSGQPIYDFRLGADKAAKGVGTNLSSWSSIAPGITNDILGAPRGSSWDIGPYQSDPTLVLWLSFNAWNGTSTNIVDDSGWTNTAFAPGTNNPTLWTNSPVGYGAHFDSGNPIGANGAYPYKGSYLAVTNLYGLTGPMTNGTISLWAHYDTNATGAVALMDGGYGVLETNSWRLWRKSGPQTVFTVFDNTGADQNSGVFNDYTSSNATTGWHHYVQTWDASDATTNFFKSYFDGALYFETNYSAAASPFLRVGSSHHWMAIGCWHHEGTYQYDLPEDLPNCGWMSGEMDDIRIYNRTLSSNEVASLYAGAGVGIAAPSAPAADTNIYPITASSGIRHFIDHQGNPYFVNGDAAWSLAVQLNASDLDQYLADRASRGYNSILVNAIEHYFCDHPPTNTFNQSPFTAKIGGTYWDFTARNEAYFTNLDAVISKAGAYGIQVLLFPAYLGVSGGSQGWYSEMVGNTLSGLTNYGTFLGNRYKNYPNIVWVHGGDYNPASHDVVNAVQAGIASVDTNHIHIAHTRPNYRGLQDYTEAWNVADTIYDFPTTYSDTLDSYAISPAVPSFLLESYYEGENSAVAFNCRNEAWWSVLSGASGHIFGNHYIWQFITGWQTALSSTGSTTITNVATLLTSKAWTNLVPDSAHTVVTAGYGSGSTYVAAARTSNGGLILAYLPTISGITVDMTKINGAVSARWYDPVSGSYSTIAGSPFPNTGSRVFTPTGTNSGGTNDWVLVLEGGPGFSGTTVYMSPSGDDGNLGTIDLPVLSSGQAQSIAYANSVTNIHLLSGVYTSPFVFTNSTIYLSGDAGLASIISNCTYGAIYADAGVAGTLSNIWIDGIQTTKSDYGIRAGWRSGGIRNCWVHDSTNSGIAIFYTNTAPWLIEDNLVTTNGSATTDHGFYIVLHDSVFRRNRMIGNYTWGVQFYGGPVTNVIPSYNNQIYNNLAVQSPHGGGMTIWGGPELSGTNWVYNNTVASNATYGLVSDYGVVLATNNIVTGNPTANMATADGGTIAGDYNLASVSLTPYNGTHDVVAAPGFVGGGSYAITTSSAAKDVALTLTAFSTDILGVSRPQGAGWDIGAYEYQSSGGVAGNMSVYGTVRAGQIRRP